MSKGRACASAARPCSAVRLLSNEAPPSPGSSVSSCSQLALAQNDSQHPEPLSLNPCRAATLRCFLLCNRTLSAYRVKRSSFD